MDDLDVVDAARRVPQGFLTGSERTRVRTVKRDPDLLLALKRVIYRHLQRGQDLLTGSANLLSMRRVSELLVGRAR